MADYIFSARNSTGQKVADWVEADSADDAARRLEEDGWCEIVIHTVDLPSILKLHTRLKARFTAQEILNLRKRNSNRWVASFRIAWRVYRWFWFITAPALVTHIVLSSMRAPLGGPHAGALLALVLPLLVAGAVATGIRRPVIAHARLVEAVGWGRWEVVLRLLPELPPKFPVDYRAGYKAKALAGLGRLEEALQVWEPFAGGARIPEWIYWSKLASIYRAAHDNGRAFACAERAAELAPEHPVALIGWATALLLRKRDVARAAVVLRQAKTHALSELSAAHVDLAEGIMAIEQGKHQDAKVLLEQGLAGLSQIRMVALLGMPDLVHAYLCLAQAGLGETERAIEHWKQAAPRLQAWREDELIDRCEQALANAPKI